MVKYLDDNEFILAAQHGFVSKKRSCQTNLLETLEEWMEALDEGYGIHAIFLDYRKAFDTVPHKRLISKLKGYGLILHKQHIKNTNFGPEETWGPPTCYVDNNDDGSDDIVFSLQKKNWVRQKRQIMMHHLRCCLIVLRRHGIGRRRSWNKRKLCWLLTQVSYEKFAIYAYCN